MPINVTLHFPKNQELIEELLKCPGFERTDATSILTGKDYFDYTRPAEEMDHLCLSVKTIALEETLYGHVYKPAEGLVRFLEPYRMEPVFLPQDLKHKPDLEPLFRTHELLIGKWKFDFVRWIKFLAKKFEVMMKLTYEHERGDSLYETAYWFFQYTRGCTVLESFGITNYESHPAWKSTVGLLNNGEVIKNYEEF